MKSNTYLLSSTNSLYCDYHLHSTYSPDAADMLEDMCEHAIAMGMQKIAFTEHVEWHPDWKHQFDPAAYLDEIARLNQRYQHRDLEIFAGIEVGNLHHHPIEYEPFLNKHPFDLVVGSLHWLNHQNIHTPACFVNDSPDDVYRDYFKDMGQMLEHGRFNILGHFDRIFWQGFLLNKVPNLRELEENIREMLATLARRRIILELNTTFLGHVPNWNEFLLEILCWYKEEGGELIKVSSDAHQKQQIGRNFDLAYQIVNQANLCKEAHQLPIRDFISA